MKLRTLIFRTLAHYRALNAALLLAIALATAVLTGSLLVGDSVRHSLRTLATQRLGPVESVLLAPDFVDISLVERLNADPDFVAFYGTAHAGITLQGRIADVATNLSASSVSVFAIDHPDSQIPAGKTILNNSLADLLNPAPDAALHLTIPAPVSIPLDATLARRSRSDILAAANVSLDRIVSGPSFLSLFSLAPSQRSPRNLWLNLRDLQSAIDRPHAANFFIFTRDKPSALPPPTRSSSDALKKHFTLADYHLALQKNPATAQLDLTSTSTYLRPSVLTALQKIAPHAQLFSTNLLTQVTLAPPPSQPSAPTPQPLHYVIATATNAPLTGSGGGEGAALNDHEVAINQWTADQLHAKVGDTLSFAFLRRIPDGTLREMPSSKSFTIAAILPPDHPLATDPALTPNYPGLTDSDSVADWSPPEGFPFNPKLVTPADEDYWKDHRAAPKIFLPLSASNLWATPLGTITSARLPVEIPPENPQSAMGHWPSAILQALNPADFGFSFQPLRKQQLAAASGSTDFSALFLGFSFFLIFSALCLLALLAKLAVEQRLPQLGLLASLGFSPQKITRSLLAEFLSLALLGTLLGTLAAIVYTALIIHLLTTWWLPAVGTTALHLHLSSASLLQGPAISLFITALTLFLSLRKYAHRSPISLLTGTPPQKISTRKPPLAPPKKTLKIVPCTLNLRRLASRNNRLHPTRSFLIIALLASASFLLVLVASMKQLPPADPSLTPSGTGGFRLILTADIPLLGNLNTREGRQLLALKDPHNPLLSRAHYTNLRASPGQDISCLNMTQPTQPAILEFPPGILSRFLISSPPTPLAELRNLLTPLTGPIPVFADQDTAQYILHLHCGDSLPFTDQSGQPRTLQLDATLSGSIFQSQLLMDSAHFSALFPLQTGYSVVLIECPEEDALPLQKLLEFELADFSVSVEPTTARLARYKEVANTYLATFQSLGSLGLLLGTLGLAIVLLRSTLERRAELALLLALGFTKSFLTRLLLLENASLLLVGLTLGTLPALSLALFTPRPLNFPALALSFTAILLAGLLSLLLALPLATKSLTPASLRNH